jgi:multisubunit Na+/H+ antiporter MnhC subunit
MMEYVVSVMLMITGLYAVVFKYNLIKKVMGLSILTNGVHLFLILIGYKAGGLPPILLAGQKAGSVMLVDPLPQALVLTSIVINVSILAVALSITAMLYREYGTLDTREIRGLRE